MRKQRHGDPPVGYPRRQLWRWIALEPLVAMHRSSVLPVHRCCRFFGWDITALKEPREGAATGTPALPATPNTVNAATTATVTDRTLQPGSLRACGRWSPPPLVNAETTAVTL
jgi:hypothetical protein